MNHDARLEQAKTGYERAMFFGERDALAQADRDLDGVEADLALARGRLMHARFFSDSSEDTSAELAAFERAAELYQALGDARGEGEARFWIGTFHQVIRGDNDSAVPAFESAHHLALSVDDRLTVSYVVRHLGFVDAAAGRFAPARAHLEESVRLRRELGFAPGVAAGLLSLAELAHDEGRIDDVGPLLAEAAEVATGCGAQAVLNWIDEISELLKNE